MIRPSSLAIVPVLLIVISASHARSAEATLESIQEQYAAHDEQLQQLLVHWRTTSTVMQPGSGTYVNVECRAALKGPKRFYDIHYTPVAGSSLPEAHRHLALSYDGSETRILGRADHARIWPGDKREYFNATDDFLALQGYPKSKFRVWINRRPLSCKVVELLGDDDYALAETKTVDGVDCIQVAASHDRLCFDPKRGYALLERELSDPETGNIHRRYSFRDFVEVQTGFWLAREIISEFYDKGQLKSRSQLEVVGLELEDVPDSLFSLEFATGTAISDVRHFPAHSDGKVPVVSYRIPADPEDLDAIVAEAVERRRHFDMQAEQGQSFRWILLVANAVILVAIVGALLWHRFRKRSLQP